MGRNEFDGRIADLQRRVGRGKLTGRIYRPGPYAAVQEKDYTLKHPNGGQAGFQESALYDGHGDVLQAVADAVLGGDVEQAMAAGMRRVDAVAAARAPKDTTALARSGRVSVSSDGRVVVDSPPTGGNPARDRANRRRPRRSASNAD